MRQRREILIAVIVAEDPHRPCDANVMCKHIEQRITEIVDQEDYVIGVEYLDDEWGEPV